MAKTKILNDAVVINSSMKFEDLQTIKKYRPNALVLKGGEDGREPVFTVFVRNDGQCGIDDNGIVFGAATQDDEKLATITMVVKAPEGMSVKDVVIDKFGGALAKLSKLEENLTEVLSEIKAEKKTVEDSISVI